MKQVLIILMTLTVASAIEVGSISPVVKIEGKDGGKLDGMAWSSSMLKGKIHLLFYVDPDKRDLNNALADTLKAKNYDREKVSSIAVINLAATWLPNLILEQKLKEKQKKFPDTLYVKDKKKVLVKQWKLKDDDSDILIFDKNGKLIYKKFGKLNEEEISAVISLIDGQL